MQNKFEKLHDQYSSSLYRFISSKINRHEDAEEILQDTWLSIFDSLPMFNGKSSFLTWAKAIASHEVADFYRKRKLKTFVFSHLPFIGNLVSQALGPELIFEKKELKEELARALASLNEGYSQILRLKYIENQTMAAIAKLLNCSEKAVESRLFRARLAFQKIWSKNYQNGPLKFYSLSLLKRAI
mgnify:CR=1 FL=1